MNPNLTFTMNSTPRSGSITDGISTPRSTPKICPLRADVDLGRWREPGVGALLADVRAREIRADVGLEPDAPQPRQPVPRVAEGAPGVDGLPGRHPALGFDARVRTKHHRPAIIQPVCDLEADLPDAGASRPGTTTPAEPEFVAIARHPVGTGQDGRREHEPHR